MPFPLFHTLMVLFSLKVKVYTQYIMWFYDTKKSNLRISRNYFTASHCGKFTRYFEMLMGCALLYITYISMLTFMQDMLLSLCLLSAAFTVEKEECDLSGWLTLCLWYTPSTTQSFLLTKYLIKNLVKPRYKCHITAVQSNLLIIHPHLLRREVN